MEQKLGSLGEVWGVVAGQWGEVSQAVHSLLDDMATSCVRVAGPSTGQHSILCSKAVERATVIAGLRRRVGVTAVRCQASSLLYQLEALGPGEAAVQGRMCQVLELERR